MKNLNDCATVTMDENDIYIVGVNEKNFPGSWMWTDMPNEIRIWLNENMDFSWFHVGGPRFGFFNSIDAIAFKFKFGI